MEISDFAVTVLRSSHLADKLVDPGALSDLKPSRHAAPEGSPGRPRGAELDGGAAPPSFPSASSLADPSGRALALHFFANHELMALELMALTLLRFPDAEPAFRRGIAQTMLDEQEHFRLCRDRAAELGLGFGEVGVNSYFWDALRGISKPLDYVTVLSLTLEQANLDFARWYGARFLKLGDPVSAAIMAQIHEDEIHHLAYGLRWFERWRDPGPGLWQGWLEALPDGVDPSQARGKGFCAEGRRRAGLPEDFIRRMGSLSRRRLGRPGPDQGSAGGWQDRWLGFPGPVPTYEPPQERAESPLPAELGRTLVDGLGASSPSEANTAEPILRFSLHPFSGGRRRNPALTREVQSGLPDVLAWSTGRPWDGVDRSLLRGLYRKTAGRDCPLHRMRRVAHRAALRLHEVGMKGPVSLRFCGRLHGEELRWWLDGLRPAAGPGRFAAELQRHLAPGVDGLWLHLPASVWERGGCSSPGELLDALGRQIPPKLQGEARHLRLLRGALPTADPGTPERGFSLLIAGVPRHALPALLSGLLNP